MPRTVLVSDQPVLLRGLSHVLQSRGFETAECTGVENIPDCLRAGAVPDLTVLDLTGCLNFGSLIDIHRKIPWCPVVLWSDRLPLELIFKTLEYGVRGIVSRKSEPQRFCDALRRVCAGEMEIAFAAVPAGPAEPFPQTPLTAREREIVACLRRGLRNRDIADERNIPEGTVQIYLFRLFKKMGVKNRFELVSSGVLPPGPLTAEGIPGPPLPGQAHPVQAAKKTAGPGASRPPEPA